MARHVGQATGRAAAYLTVARSKFARFSEDAKLDKLHVEMQQSMQQLSAIQSELRGNINFMNLGPLARKAMQLPPSEESLSSATSSPDPAWRRPQPSQAQHGTHQSFHPAASSFAASAANTAASLSSTLREASTVLHKTHSQEPGEQLTPLPLSAVAIGKAPSREDTTPTGSDILLDALCIRVGCIRVGCISVGSIRVGCLHRAQGRHRRLQLTSHLNACSILSY